VAWPRRGSLCCPTSPVSLSLVAVAKACQLQAELERLRRQHAERANAARAERAVAAVAAGFAGGSHDAAGAGAAAAPAPAVTPEAPAAAPPQVTEELMRTLKVPPIAAAGRRAVGTVWRVATCGAVTTTANGNDGAVYSEGCANGALIRAGRAWTLGSWERIIA